MTKYNYADISMIRVTSNDPQLEANIPLLGIQQGIAHDTKLPDQPNHMNLIAENFRDVLRDGHVEIWRLQNPAPGAGAVFLSPLCKKGLYGIQIDDVVVQSEYRGQNLGSAMIQFTAALAQSRGLSFVAWECEENNPAEKVYRQVGATPRADVKPFRLTRDIILKALQEETSPIAKAECAVSDRFSLFRTVNHGITGYDMDPTQKSYGLQIEDLTFDNVENGRQGLINLLKEYEARKTIYFVDVVIPNDSAKHLALIKEFDAEQNTYSGNPAYPWELVGEAFEKAAAIGRPLLTARPS